VIVSLFVLVYGVIEAGGPAGWSPRNIGIIGIGLLLAAAFLVFEHRSAHPMLPTSLFANHSFSVATITGLLLNFGFYGQFFVLTLYLQQFRHIKPLTAGLLLVPEAVGAIIGSPMGGLVAARIGNRLTMAIGLAVGAVGFLGLLPVTAHTSYLLIIPAAFLAGLGMSFAMPAATTAAIEAAPRERAGLAAGAVNTARQLGSVLGVAVLGAFIAAGHPFIPGFRIAVGCSAAIFLIGAVLNLIIRPAPRVDPAGPAPQPGAVPTGAGRLYAADGTEPRNEPDPVGHTR
jgi:DHA2 family methylenomycin A resistance protein-like MFS transporter